MLAIRDELLERGHRASIIATTRSTQVRREENVYHPRTPGELVRLLMKLDYDVLHLHVGGDITKRVLGLAAVCVAFGRGRSVITIHSGGYPLSKAGRAARRLSARGAVFRRFERVVAVNPLIADVFRRYGVAEEKLSVVYPFAHRRPDPSVGIPEKLKRFIEDHSPFLLSVSLLEDDYDLPVQIEAMEQILERLPQAGLLVAGSGSLESEIKDLIASKNYADGIFLAGNVEHPVTLHLINEADVLLRTTKFDGDAISVREALFLDTPVIATDNGMRPEGVHLIPIGAADALAEAVIEIASRPKKTKTEKADDKRNVVEILKIYEELSRRKGGAMERRAGENPRQTEKKDLI